MARLVFVADFTMRALSPSSVKVLQSIGYSDTEIGALERPALSVRRIFGRSSGTVMSMRRILRSHVQIVIAGDPGRQVSEIDDGQVYLDSEAFIQRAGLKGMEKRKPISGFKT